MTLIEKRDALKRRLAGLPDPQERFAWLIDQARQRPLLPVEQRVDANRVEGCLARLWFVAEWRDGQCHFASESDSLVVKAVAGVLCEFYSGHGAEEILQVDPSFLGELGITQHLTPNRRNALARVWERIRQFALAHQCGPAPATPAP